MDQCHHDCWDPPVVSYALTQDEIEDIKSKAQAEGYVLGFEAGKAEVQHKLLKVLDQWGIDVSSL